MQSTPLEITTRSPQETFELGRWLGERLRPGDVVGLDGSLGAGKTWLAKGVVAGISDDEVDETLVKSPTYNLVYEYDVPRGNATQRVVHIDFYRLETLSDTDALLMGEVFDQAGAIYLVEWAEPFLDELVDDHLAVRITPGTGDSDRTLRFRPQGAGARYQALLTELTQRAHPGD